MTGINHRIDCPTRFGEPDWYETELHPSIYEQATFVLTRCRFCRRSKVERQPRPPERKPDAAPQPTHRV